MKLASNIMALAKTTLVLSILLQPLWLTTTPAQAEEDRPVACQKLVNDINTITAACLKDGGCTSTISDNNEFWDLGVVEHTYSVSVAGVTLNYSWFEDASPGIFACEETSSRGY